MLERPPREEGGRASSGSAGFMANRRQDSPSTLGGLRAAATPKTPAPMGGASLPEPAVPKPSAQARYPLVPSSRGLEPHQVWGSTLVRQGQGSCPGCPRPSSGEAVTLSVGSELGAQRQQLAGTTPTHCFTFIRNVPSDLGSGGGH